MQLGDSLRWDLMSCYLQLRTCHSLGLGREAQGEDRGPPTPLPTLLLRGAVGSPPTLLPGSALSCAPVPALTESSLEEELNRVCGGMLVMPDLPVWSFFLGGHQSLGGDVPQLIGC